MGLEVASLQLGVQQEEEGGEGLVEQYQTKNILMAHFQLHALNIHTDLLPLTVKPTSSLTGGGGNSGTRVARVFGCTFILFEDPVTD